MMQHVVLLGDSIFDNAAYVGGGPDVIRQLRDRLPEGFQATLAAIDGAVTRGVESQLRGAPKDATALVVSAGGNDALGHTGLLSESARSAAEVIARLSDMAEGFERDYRQMLDAVLSHGIPTAVCTIYNPRFPDAELQRLCTTALTVFNDVILRLAFAAGIPVLDLRLICTEDRDYANPIEPSSHGGDKISAAVATLLATHDFGRGRSEVYLR